MADRYWIGPGNWDATAGTKWASTSGGPGGESVPTIDDDVFFDDLSSTSCTVSGSRSALSINCTGYTKTLAGTGALTVAGSITFVTGMGYTHTGSITITGTGTLTTAGKTVRAVTINAPGGTVTLGSALTIGASQNLTVLAGTLDTSTSNYSILNVGTFSNSDTLVLNGSSISCNNLSSPNSFFTINAGTSTITVSSGISAPAEVLYDVVVNGITNATFNAGVTSCRNLTFNALGSSGVCVVDLQNDITLSGTLTFAAPADATRRYYVVNNSGFTYTISAGTTVLNDVDFRSVTAAGGGSWSGTRVGNATGNSGITFAAAKTVYWNLATGGNWNSTAWATTGGGTPAANNFPLPQDTAVFQSTGLNSGATVTMSLNYAAGTIDMSARTANTMILSIGAGTPQIVGDLISGSGVTISDSNTSAYLRFVGVNNTQTITSAGAAIGIRIWIQKPGGTLTFADNTTFSANTGTITTIKFTEGTINVNGKTVTLSGATSGFNCDSVLLTGSSRVITWNGGTFSIAGSGDAWSTTVGNTTSAGTGSGTIRFTSASAKTFGGGNGVNWNCTIDQNGAGDLLILFGNTYTNITNSYASTGATSITFSSGYTTTVSSFTASGTVGKILTIKSNSPGTRFTLSDSSGTNAIDYVSITDSAATGGAVWDPGLNSINGGNNTGWLFPAGGSGNMFMLFS